MTRTRVGIVLLVCAVLLPAHATITARLSDLSLKPTEKIEYDFTPTTTGEIMFRLALRTSPATVRVQLFFEGRPAIDQTGSATQTAKTEVSEADVGRPWRLVVTNLSSQTVEGRFELTYPRRFCKEISVQYRVKVSYEIGTELEDLHCQQLYNTLRSLPSEHLRRLREIRAREPDLYLYGQYFPPSLIELPGLRAGRTFTLVAYHELGHLVHFTRSTADQQERWEKLFNESGRDPDNFARDPIDRSLYAMTNQYEDFAVTYSAYIADSQVYISEALTRSQRSRPLLLQKFKLIVEYFRHVTDNQQRVYIYRVGTEAPIPTIYRASVPVTAESLPDFTGPIQWESF
ncbi:MAG: putative zinc-binding metallopeptidase [Candidatus Bipolaricaulota bacterium]|nr:putative zinc-binding metallopeptidase [Candidatus Bipolaricaulota bacterium]